MKAVRDASPCSLSAHASPLGLQVRAILYIATLTTGIMEAVTNVDHAVAAALSTRHHPHSPTSSTRSTRKLRVQAAILMPVREALKNLHESDDCAWRGKMPCTLPAVTPQSCIHTCTQQGQVLTFLTHLREPGAFEHR